MREYLAAVTVTALSLQYVMSQLATLDGIFRVSPYKRKGMAYLWSCQESASGSVMCLGAERPTLNYEDEENFGFPVCEGSSSNEGGYSEGRRLKAGKHGKHHYKYGKHHHKYGKHHHKYGKYGKYWKVSPDDYYDGRVPSELYRDYYDYYYGDGAYDRDYPSDAYSPENGEFSMPEVSMPPFSIPVGGPPENFKPAPPKKKLPPKKGKPFGDFPSGEDARQARALQEGKPRASALRIMEVEPMPVNVVPNVDVTIVNMEEGDLGYGQTGVPSVSFGHQLTNGSYRMLHSSIKGNANDIPNGYYTIVPERSSSGDFKKATCYGSQIGSKAQGDT